MGAKARKAVNRMMRERLAEDRRRPRSTLSDQVRRRLFGRTVEDNARRMFPELFATLDRIEAKNK